MKLWLCDDCQGRGGTMTGICDSCGGTGKMTDFFAVVGRAVKNAGLTGTLMNTGGGVMVYHVIGTRGVSVGIDEETVCAYVNDEQIEAIPVWTIPPETSLEGLVNVATKLLRLAEQQEG